MALPDPLESGSVVRIESHLSKYPEVWVLSHINGGRWYPDTDSWMASHARGPLEDGGAHWEDLLARGRVTLLVAVDRESYEAGWSEPRPDLVEVVARVITEHNFRGAHPDAITELWGGHVKVARAVLAALSSVGALMPDGGGRTRERLGFGTQRPPATGPVQVWWADEPQHASWTPTRRRTVTTWPEGHPLAGTHYGLWTEAIDAAHA